MGFTSMDLVDPDLENPDLPKPPPQTHQPHHHRPPPHHNPVTQIAKSHEPSQNQIHDSPWPDPPSPRQPTAAACP